MSDDRENILKEINFLAHSPGVNAWLRDRLQVLHRAVRKLEADERERCAKIAEAEPELPGEPKPHELVAMSAIGLIATARASVRATKQSIAAAIRAAN